MKFDIPKKEWNRFGKIVKIGLTLYILGSLIHIFIYKDYLQSIAIDCFLIAFMLTVIAIQIFAHDVNLKD